MHPPRAHEERAMRTEPSDTPAPSVRTGEPFVLSEREAQIADLLVEGCSNQEIADRIFLAHETVKSYVVTLRQKLGARNRVHAAVLLVRNGWSTRETRSIDGTTESRDRRGPPHPGAAVSPI
jgi:DNA-binding NarL/FixJ family response regulator